MPPYVGNRASVWIPPDATITRPNNATGYSANQVIGNATTSTFTYSNFFLPGSNMTGLLTGMVLYASVASIATSNLGNITAYLYNTVPSFSPLADQQTFQTLLADEPPNCIGTVKFSSYVIGGTGSTTIYGYGAPDITPMPISSVSGPGGSINSPNAYTLYVVLVATAAFTPIANAILRPYVCAVFD